MTNCSRGSNDLTEKMGPNCRILFKSTLWIRDAT